MVEKTSYLRGANYYEIHLSHLYACKYKQEKKTIMFFHLSVVWKNDQLSVLWVGVWRRPESVSLFTRYKGGIVRITCMIGIDWTASDRIKPSLFGFWHIWRFTMIEHTVGLGIVKFTYLLLLPLNIVGNSLVCILFSKKSSALKSSLTNSLLLNLAIADLLLGLVVLICSLLVYIFGLPITDVYCKISGGTLYLTCSISVCTLAIISLERYIAILKPVFHRKQSRDPRLARVIRLTWLISFLVVSPVVVFLKRVKVNENQVDCGFKITDDDINFGRIYDGVVVLILFLVPNALICWLYGRIMFSLWFSKRHTDKERNVVLQRSRKKLTKLMLTVTLVFTVSWIPYYVRTALSLILPNTYLFFLNVVVCRIFIIINSSANPAIYTFQSRRFRKELKELFSCRRDDQ